MKEYNFLLYQDKIFFINLYLSNKSLIYILKEDVIY